MNSSIQQAVPKKQPPLRRFGLALAIACVVVTGVVMVEKGNRSEARQRLGGDIEIVSGNQPLPMRATAFLNFNAKSVSRVMEMGVSAKHGQKTAAAALKCVDRAYPLYGELALSDRKRKKVFARIPRRAMWGVAVNRPLLDALGIKPGQRFSVGKINFLAAAVIENEPDASPQQAKKPRIITARPRLCGNPVLQPTSPVNHRYRIALKGLSVKEWREKWVQAFPNAPWQVATWRD